MKSLKGLELVVENQIVLDRIEIFAQPIVDLQNPNSDKKHFEILSRFYDNFGNLIMPEGIFSGNRTTQELVGLDRLIFSKSFKILNSLSALLENNYLAAINVSEASVFNRISFLDYVDSQRKRYGIDPKNIQLEITERSDKCIKQFVSRALKHGYNVSVDDFASKNFTMGKLRKQVLDGRNEDELKRIKIKVDMQYILHLSDLKNPYYNSDRAVINMALDLQKDKPQITTVAEGVEDESSAQYLKKIGIDYGQGYFWQKPQLLNLNYMQPY